MILTHKTECFPNRDQIKIIEQNFGMRRFYFNKTISYLKHKYGNLKVNKHLITKKEVMGLRKDLFRNKYKSLVETCSSEILDTALEDVMFALNSLWKKGREISLRKKKFSNTCRFFRKTKDSFRFRSDKMISLSRLKNLKLAEPLRWDINPREDIKTVTIKKEANRYFISIAIQLDDNAPNIKQNTHLGIDWGLKTYITGFDGKEIIETDFNESILRKLDKNIAKYQRKLSKKIQYSNNFKKVTIKLQQAYLNFNNYRLDFIKQIVNELNNLYDTVSIEKLSMGFVMKNKHLAKRANQKPYYILKETLVNKFNQFNKDIYYVPHNYSSTQTCSSCGNVKKDNDKLKLGDKIYKCNICDSIHDRDVNAAINIYNYRNLEKVILQ